MYPYVGYLSIELAKKKPLNFVDKYITPYLSFYYDDKDRIREHSSKQISKDLRIWLKEQGYKKRFNLNNLMVVEKKMGHTKADIRIGVISDDHQKALKAIRDIEERFSQVKGIKYFGDNVKIGVDEIKLNVNSYGEELGITEKYLGSYVSDLYLSKRVGTIFDGNELVEIQVKTLNIEDDLDRLADGGRAAVVEHPAPRQVGAGRRRRRRLRRRCRRRLGMRRPRQLPRHSQRRPGGCRCRWP